MKYESGISLGRIAKIHGNEGSVSVKLEKEFVDNIPEMESVFLEIEGKPVPFFISRLDYKGGTDLRMQFDGYKEYEKICEFNGCRIFLTSTPDDYSQPEDLTGLSGFHVYSSQNEYIGAVAEIIDNPGQSLLSVLPPGGKEILIPLHEDFIVTVSRRKKIIVMNLPEGLAEVNT